MNRELQCSWGRCFEENAIREALQVEEEQVEVVVEEAGAEAKGRKGR